MKVHEPKKMDSQSKISTPDNRCLESNLYWQPSMMVARVVDIIDQLSTTFKIPLCTMYKENFPDYPSQLYWRRILQERWGQLKNIKNGREMAVL